MRLTSLICCQLFLFTLQSAAQTAPTQPGTTTNRFTITGIPDAGLSNQFGFLVPNVAAIDIYGGAAGALIDGCADGTRPDASTCNNCSSGTTPCNTRRIHADLGLTINYQYNGPPLGIIAAELADIGGNNRVPIEGIRGLNANAAGSFTIPWREICKKVGGSNVTSVTTTDDCLGTYNLSGRLFIGVSLADATVGGPGNNTLQDGQDIVQTQYQINIHYRGGGTINDIDNNTFCTNKTPNNEGACNFSVYPGDEKVFVENVYAVSSFSQTNFSAVRVFYAPRTDANDTTIPPLTSPFKDLVVTRNTSATGGTVKIDDNQITGLTNGTTYNFAIATLDLANNLGWYRSNGTLNTCFDDLTDCHTATPEPVFGLLEKEFDCFIATAAFGSPFEPHVATFRQFRNRYLHPTPWGRWLIKKYYQYSPSWARFIAARPTLRKLVQLLLLPAWAFAQLSLFYPYWLSVFLFATLLLLLLRRLPRRTR